MRFLGSASSRSCPTAHSHSHLRAGHCVRMPLLGGALVLLFAGVEGQDGWKDLESSFALASRHFAAPPLARTPNPLCAPSPADPFGTAIKRRGW
jgi:hypothetical protein